MCGIHFVTSYVSEGVRTNSLHSLQHNNFTQCFMFGPFSKQQNSASSCHLSLSRVTFMFCRAWAELVYSYNPNGNMNYPRCSSNRNVCPSVVFIQIHLKPSESTVHGVGLKELRKNDLHFIA